MTLRSFPKPAISIFSYARKAGNPCRPQTMSSRDLRWVPAFAGTTAAAGALRHDGRGGRCAPPWASGPLDAVLRPSAPPRAPSHKGFSSSMVTTPSFGTMLASPPLEQRLGERARLLFVALHRKLRTRRAGKDDGVGRARDLVDELVIVLYTAAVHVRCPSAMRGVKEEQRIARELLQGAATLGIGPRRLVTGAGCWACGRTSHSGGQHKLVSPLSRAAP